jgi:tetratricopeptide (TPR) repeat protein
MWFMSDHPATSPLQSNSAVARLPGLGLLVAALIVMVGVAYANAIDHPFLYDDLPLVLNNPDIRSLDNLPRMIGFSENGLELRSRWTRSVTHALEYAVAGPNPAIYHATNIVLHAAVVLLVFALVLSVARDRMLGFWSAAIVAVHPINTEVVAHVSGRRDLLAALFSLLTLWLLLAHVRRGGLWRVALAALTLFLGVSSKEFALLTPAAFGLLHLYQRWRDSETRGERSLLAEVRHAVSGHIPVYAMLVLVTLGCAGMLLSVASLGGLAGSPGFYDTEVGGLGLLDRARIFGLALRLFLVPVGQSVDYSFDALGLVGSLSALALLDLAVLAGALALTLVGLWRRNWAGFAGAWFLIFFVPYLGVIPWHEVFAERFLYLPGVGLATGVAAAGLAVARLAAGRGAGAAVEPAHGVVSRAATAFGLAVLAVLTVATLSRNRVWGDGLLLWTNAAERYPNCARAHYGLGDALLMDTRPELARAEFERAIAILPNYFDARLGVALSLTAEMQLYTAKRSLEDLLEDYPTHPRALNAMGYVQEAMGNLPAAQEAYQAAVDADPTFTQAYNNLAKLRVLDGDIEGAIALYERALEYDPACLPALVNLAIVYREGLKDEEQAARYDERVRTIRRFNR